MARAPNGLRGPPGTPTPLRSSLSWLRRSRWRAIRRHAGQIERHCERGDLFCRPRQRQALLHWAYDSRKL